MYNVFKYTAVKYTVLHLSALQRIILIINWLLSNLCAFWAPIGWACCLLCFCKDYMEDFYSIFCIIVVIIRGNLNTIFFNLQSTPNADTGNWLVVFGVLFLLPFPILELLEWCSCNPMKATHSWQHTMFNYIYDCLLSIKPRDVRRASRPSFLSR